MNLISIESPALRVSITGQTQELFNRTRRIILIGESPNVVSNNLIQAGARRLRLPARLLYQPVING